MKHIKKIAVIVIVVVVFGIYTIRQRFATPDSLGENARPAKSSVSQSNSSPSSSPNQSSNSATGANNNSTGSSSALLKDGSYVGQTADAYYGYIQVKTTVSGGKLTDVTFLQYPNDRSNSVAINQRAMPLLKQQAIQAQSASVDGVSGATDTSQAFIESLSSTLKQAKA